MMKGKAWLATRPSRRRSARPAGRLTRSRRLSVLAPIALLIHTRPQQCFALLLESNPPEQPQDISSIVCDGTHGVRPNCEVEIDVPEACSAANGSPSSCPIVFFLHGSGGTNDWFGRTSGVHLAGVVGVYPQGEGGWNTGPKSTNVCDWSDFACQDDPDEGAYMARILSELRSRGAEGNVYASGNSNGAALAHRLASNAGDDLPIKGIVVKVTQLLSSPERSGPGTLNYNQPSAAGRGTPPVSVLSIMGTADGLIPYDGGPSAVFGGDDAFQLMPTLDSMEFWASHDGCDLAQTSVTTGHVTDMGDGNAVKYEYGGCQHGTIVEHFAIEGGGHGAGGVTIDGIKVDYDMTYDFIRRCEDALAAPTVPTAPSPTPPIPAPTTSAPAPSPPSSSSCADDPNWAGKFNPAHTCSYVAQDPAVRCNWEDADGVLASVACEATCNPSCLTDAPTSVPVAAPVEPPTSPVPSPVLPSPCSVCTNVATPYMDSIGEECVGSSRLTTKCNLAEWWTNNKFCQHSCYLAGVGYQDDVCCPTCVDCTDEETPWMTDNGHTCSGTNWLLNTKCNLDSSWTANEYCKLSCYNKGKGYGEPCCQSCEQSGQPCGSSQDCCHGMCLGDGKCA